MGRERTPWIEFRAPSPERALRLFCFHGAGGAAQGFRFWSRGLPRWVEVCPVQLPGRLSRMAEPPHTRLEPLIRTLLEALEPELEEPFAFFGHNLGTLIAFEIARELRRRKRKGPEQLFVAARIAPHVATELPPVHHLGDRELAAAVQERYQSIPEEIAREPELLSLVLRPLRADLEIHHTYRHTEEAPLSIPVTALGGTGDRLVTPEGLEAWRKHTTGRFSMCVLPGDHFFHHAEEKEVLRIVSAELETLVPTIRTPCRAQEHAE